MKDSGIEWIGEIPETWDVSKLKYLLAEPMKYGASETGVPYDESLFRYIRITDIDSNGGLKSDGRLSLTLEQADGYQLEDDTLLFARSGATVGKTFLYKKEYGKAAFVGYLISAVPDKKMVLPEWIMYYTYSNAYWEWTNRIFTQATIQNIGADKYSNMNIPLTEIHTQKLVIAFLDRQCAHIDNIIEKTQASIEEYKKLRQAVITQAVTKGVRGERAMKDSGIEWIGEIPEEWSVLKFKYVATVKANLVHPNEYQDYMQVAPDNIEKGTAKLLDCKTVGEVGVESDNHLFYKGQIVYSKIRPILNKIIIAPFDGLCSADMYPIETTINKHFLVYMMLSDRFLAQVKLVTENRVKMPKINQEELSQILIYLPPTNEQQEISTYLDQKCAEIDTLITKKESFLTELESYKKSMIYEYVTGKKEVPSA